jgi:hypothetical protein
MLPDRWSIIPGAFSMSRSTKMALLALPLPAAGYCIGWASARLGQAYDLILFPSSGLPWLLLRILLSFWFLSVTAGVCAALVRPVWAAVLAFVLSGLAILVGMSWSEITAAAVLIYAVAGCAYVRRVSREMAERTAFSSRPVSEAQTGLMVAAVLLASTSLYLGFSARIEAEGFSIPSEYVEEVSDRLEAAVEEHLPELVRELAIDVIRDGVGFAVNKVLVGAIQPFEDWIPLIVAVGLFAPLLTITRLLAWVPALALRAAFAALKYLRIVRVVRATRQVERLIVW